MRNTLLITLLAGIVTATEIPNPVTIVANDPSRSMVCNYNNHTPPCISYYSSNPDTSITWSHSNVRCRFTTLYIINESRRSMTVFWFDAAILDTLSNNIYLAMAYTNKTNSNLIDTCIFEIPPQGCSTTMIVTVARYIYANSTSITRTTTNSITASKNNYKKTVSFNAINNEQFDIRGRKINNGTTGLYINSCIHN